MILVDIDLFTTVTERKWIPVKLLHVCRTEVEIADRKQVLEWIFFIRANNYIENETFLYPPAI